MWATSTSKWDTHEMRLDEANSSMAASGEAVVDSALGKLAETLYMCDN